MSLRGTSCSSLVFALRSVSAATMPYSGTWTVFASVASRTTSRRFVERSYVSQCQTGSWAVWAWVMPTQVRGWVRSHWTRFKALLKWLIWLRLEQSSLSSVGAWLLGTGSVLIPSEMQQRSRHGVQKVRPPRISRQFPSRGYMAAGVGPMPDLRKNSLQGWWLYTRRKLGRRRRPGQLRLPYTEEPCTYIYSQAT